ncbi:UDP-N-acetylmuramate dehydrogenase [Candidatus Falkowbacteria bacterium]|nr:UDP-N-acetylmuramate dehydrogenase [Candidatus Falkowbacteria bacterium]
MLFKINEPLSKYTTFKIGGDAKYFFIAKSSDELIKAINEAKKKKLNYIILGGGSNILVSDSGFDGLVIINKNDGIKFQKEKVIAGSGTILMNLVHKSIEKGLTGLEWAVGIPGTLGGAVRGNAGAYRGQTSDNVSKVEVLRNDKKIILDKKDCSFGYRQSIFQNNKDLILSVELKLKAGDRAESEKKIEKLLEDRKNKQPLEFPSAGSVFKNVLIDDNVNLNKLRNLPREYLEYKKIPAAWLIDTLDLKGKTIGGAQVSSKHANFIINLDKATANDVLQLISYIKMKVRDKYNIELMEEVEYIGF